MNYTSMLAYVKTTAALLEATLLAAHDGLAEIYRPVAFPPNKDGRE